MKDTLNDSPNSMSTIVTRNHLTRSTSLQSSPQQLQQQSQALHHMQTKWSIKERLFLVSCVLLNGESNWTFISDQLNKWMKYTSNYTNLPMNGNTNISILGSNSINVSPVNIRTNNQCSKQYKFIVKSYAVKHGINDLKKVYSHLAEERLKELKNLVLNSHHQYKDIYDEIEQILEMDTNNFEQLTEMWHNLKSSETSLNNNKSNYSTRLNNQEQSKTNDLFTDEDAANLDKNIEKLNELNRRKREEIEAAARAAAEAAAKQAELEAQKEAERAAAEAALTRDRIMATNSNNMDQLMQIDATLNQDQNNRIDNQQIETIEIKLEKNISISENDNKQIENQETKQNDIKPITVELNEDKQSSDEEMPKLNPKKKQKQSDNNVEKGIEWKPVVASPEETISNSQNQLKSNLETDDDSDTELQVKRPEHTYSSPRKPRTVIESSSSSSESESKNEPSNSTSKIGSPKIKIEEPVISTVQQQTQPAQPTRKSNRTRNSLSNSIIKDSTTNTKNEDSELIFTPLIKYDKKAEEPQLTTLVNDTVTKVEEREDITSELASDKEDKKSENGAEITRSDKRKQKSNKKEPETLEETQEEVSSVVDNDEETEEQTTRASTLRSKQRNTNSSSLNTSNNKRRSSNVQKISKNLIVSVTNTKINNRGLLSPKMQQSSLGHEEQIAQDTELQSTKDSGLLSIKCEPVQISNTSIITSTDIDSAKTDDLNESSVMTRSSRNKDSINNAPFSSSSTSSILSNNSSGSLINKFEDEKAYRAWKKSILMVLNNIACHKHATVFMHPVKDDIAPGYSSVVNRPMDLGTLKKNIENGLIKSTKEFQRDIMLMFTNAIMYNSSGHDVHKISIEMYKEVLTDVEQLLNAQEAMGEEQKPLRFKDKRSSTASDRGAIISGIELERNESNESNSEPVVNILMTTKKEAFSKGDEALETASLNSSSSVSQNLNKTNINMSSKEKFDSNLSCSTSVSTITSSSTTTNTKKRRPSSESSQIPKDLAKEQPKSKKRRKSGR